MEQCYKLIVKKVMYNEWLYMGACGGAVCAFRHYWTNTDLRLFDFFMGVDLHYQSCTQVELCMENMSILSPKKWMITSGAGLAVHIKPGMCTIKSFECSKNTRWEDFCDLATQEHRYCIQYHAPTAETGPYFHPTVPATWWCRLDGTMRTAF